MKFKDNRRKYVEDIFGSFDKAILAYLQERGTYRLESRKVDEALASVL